uniref:Endoribonuclease L-PSP family protein n=1 Tax=uncultured Flavobacteriia bacterium TaxID=212695 RepID=H6RH33_9BACT|nr:endoribonuclease L-PSP [uncultured bacterium]CCG00344.1 endoribonuclease L-PSP family protein [uncultured Flavobacteriia bacterium]
MKKLLYILVLTFGLILFSCSSPKAQNKTNQVNSDFNPEAKLDSMKIVLPQPPTPVANFVNTVQAGNLLFLSGNGPLKADGKFITGKLGADLSIKEGYEAARITGINQLGVIKSAIGDLSRVKRIVRVTGMVNASPDFTQHPSVVNGFSDLMVAVFGEKGKHTRAAVGMGSLPFNIAVEIDMIVEIE